MMRTRVGVLLCVLSSLLRTVHGHTNTECYYEVRDRRDAAKLNATVLRRHTPLPDVSKQQFASYVWPAHKKPDRRVFYGSQANLTSLTSIPFCGCIYRFKIIKGQLWGDKDNSPTLQERFCANDILRSIIQEMLLLAIWTYDLPDLEVAAIGRERHLCNFDFPFLAYSVGPDSLGVALPLFNTWQHLASSPSELAAQRACLIRSSAGRKQISKVFWRGSSTGYEAVWRNSTQRVRELNDRTSIVAPSILLKRVHAVLTCAPFDFMDVKLSTLSRLPNYNRLQSKQLSRELSRVMVSRANGAVPLSAWSRYAVQLSLDGYGPAFREPVQMLGNSVLLRTDSPLQLWYHQLLKPAVHIETFDYDNLDLVARSKWLLEEFSAGGTRLSKQVQAMNAFALEHFTLEGQLRSFVWGLLKVRQLLGWAPQLTPDFQLVKQEKTKWRNPFISEALRNQIMKDLPQQYQ